MLVSWYIICKFPGIQSPYSLWHCCPERQYIRFVCRTFYWVNLSPHLQWWTLQRGRQCYSPFERSGYLSSINLSTNPMDWINHMRALVSLDFAINKASPEKPGSHHGASKWRRHQSLASKLLLDIPGIQGLHTPNHMPTASKKLTAPQQILLQMLLEFEWPLVSPFQFKDIPEIRKNRPILVQIQSDVYWVDNDKLSYNIVLITWTRSMLRNRIIDCPEATNSG